LGTAWLDGEVMFERLRRHGDDGLISEADNSLASNVKKLKEQR
jgi:hypothetical protein